ncbi:MAG: XF1762 family protein, partial [Micromonosporaceae bacterium]
MRLRLVPVRFRDACAFVQAHHRHHLPPQGMRYAIGVADDTGVLRGVAIAGRPVARHFDDGQTIEVTRVATDGARNACSMLYAAVWRAAK